MKKIIHTLILCICITFLYSTTVFATTLGIKGRILFISSYSYNEEMVQTQIEGITNALGQEYELDYEYMDTKRVKDEASLQLFYEGLEYRMSQVKPYDVIIVGDDAALQFVLEHRAGLFDDIPIVFEGVSNETLIEQAVNDSLITGIVGIPSVENNIELALEFVPEATNVLAILDSSVDCEVERELFYRAQEQFPQLEFGELDTSQMSAAELQWKLARLSEDTILFVITMAVDAEDKPYNSNQIGDFMLQYSSVPAFRMVETGIGSGLMGGNVVSMYKSGEVAARMAKSIIAGVSVAHIAPIMDSPRQSIIDEEVVRKYKLDMNSVPEGVTIINHKENFFERNEEAVIPVILLAGFAIFVLIFAIVDSRKKRQMVNELSEAKKILENASQHDFLTGLPNRSKFMVDIEKLIAENVPCTVLMLDLDGFKHINDTYGHAAGDVVLKEIANRMKALQSYILTPYRYAGDEFIMILRSAQPDVVETAAYDCRGVFVKNIKLQDIDYKVTGSIGVASFPKDAQDGETLISCADSAMYAIKKSGKNMFAYYKAGMESEKKIKKE